MADININEYVRTKNQGIFIISHINMDFDDSDFKKVCICQNKKVAFTNIDTIKELKHSPSIIDLIEVGDYVNGYKVIGVTLDTVNKCVDIDCDKPSYESYLFEEQIYSIVTKEQFENMEYRLEN